MVEEHTARHAPMQRTGTPQEIAAMAVFLASNESSYCTGAEFVVDGGFTAGYPAPGSPNPY
jgi:3alpha(or 20beta)-hydroxysteroid dehydrogenase